jgi:L-rhamnose mutarotase
MRRMGLVIGIKPGKIEEYKAYHAAVWPEVLAMITECNIKNYTIFLREPENLLFAYFEYHGTDYAADMEKMAQHEPTRRWWAINAPCQEPLSSRAPGEHWAMMEDVFHVD